MPSFPLPSLVSLNMSSNKLTFVPSTALANMTSVRGLDLSNNYLPSPPAMVWHIMPRLRTLSLASNPIKTLTNESFLSLDRLENLDISYMDIESIEIGTFGTMPNLKELKVSVGKIPGLNLGSHLSGNPGLHHLHLVLSAPGGQETNLHRELQSPLPVSLNRVTVEASKMSVLHPAALKHLTSASLQLSVISDDVRLERDLFLNLGSVQNLSLDISGSVLASPNTTLAEIANPSTKYRVGIPNSVFLKDLVLGQKALPCSCHSVGWIAKWIRKMRNLFCLSSDSYVEFGGRVPRCRGVIRDLREARCQNYQTGVLENLNNYLECLSFNSAPNTPHSLVRTLVIILTLQRWLL